MVLVYDAGFSKLSKYAIVKEFQLAFVKKRYCWLGSLACRDGGVIWTVLCFN